MIESTVIAGDSEEVDALLADDCGQYYDDPYGWVLWAFDWGEGELTGFEGPDNWQVDELKHIGAEVVARGFDVNNPTPVDPIREAIASGHGIGKSAFTAWVILWIMSTRPHAKGIVTANTGDQLRTKTWAEVGKWRSRCIVGHWFEYNNGKGSMSLYHKDHSESWRVDAQTCREENSEAFAGLHSASSTPFYIFDEASAVPDSIWEVAEGGLTDGEPMFFVFGNPTRNSGKFKECFTRQAHRWNTRQIDSRTAKMTNKKLLAQWKEDWGEDSDFFRVRVLGKFPRGGDMQFFPSDIVLESQKRDPRYMPDDPLICGIDYARGGEDKCVIQFRRGFDAKSETVYTIKGEDSRDSMVVASKIVNLFHRMQPDAVFGDVGSMGGPINDRLRGLGWHVMDVGFGHKADDELHYHNKTSEMCGRLLEWMQKGGAIQDNDELERELVGREFQHDSKDRLQIESKKDFKKRLGYSPDWKDALLLTFATHVPKLEIRRDQMDRLQGRRSAAQIDAYDHSGVTNMGDYDPLD